MKKRAAKKRKRPVPGSQTRQPAERALKKMHALHAAAGALHRQSDSLHKRSDALHRKAETVAKRTAKKGGGVRVGKLPPRGPAAERVAARERMKAPTPRPDVGAAPRSALPFSVVGIGASAGGYEAVAELVSTVPKNLGFAIVVLQHLDPHHESRLRDLLAGKTELPAVEIRNGMYLEANKVYVLPSNATVLLEGRRFKLGPRQERGGPMPIDFFFRSLANEQQNRAIGVVLSGTGTDGTLGLAEIKGQGGITFAQDKASAKFFGMPGSAIAAGVVDFILSPEGIAKQLRDLADHSYVGWDKEGDRPPGGADGAAEAMFQEHPLEMKTLFTLLRVRREVDFSLYKPGTLNRRIMRRMAMHRFEELPDYVRTLQQNPGELDALFNDLLISVTGFFRDPASFDALKKKILPKLLKNRAHDTPIRIWTCGCATGEEAYSLAIVVAEFLEETGRRLPVQVFASDLNERGIEKARAGMYHENILIDVSPERLRRFFVKVDGFFQVSKQIRDMCVFARQNVATDPPFSNLDLISCRNVLIYLTPVLQRRIMPVFHYALKPGGFMLLGSSESIGDSSEMFEVLDRKHKIYIKKTTAYRPSVELERAFTPPREALSRPKPPPPAPPERPASLEATLHERVDRLILHDFSPTGVVINAQMDVLQFRGKTGVYLEHQSGTASLSLLKMAREDLALDLRRAVNKAVQSGQRVEVTSEMRPAGKSRPVRVEVHPLPQIANVERFFFVTFRDVTPPDAEGPEGRKGRGGPQPEAKQIARLRDELAATKDSLQAIIEEQDATNEELKSANEEIQSSNEELQSTNEELETAREELQSTNEELTTLNEELQNRNAELGVLNNDLTNLLSSVNIAIIMLGTDSKIRRFTPMAERLFNLIPSDVGRRFSDLTRSVEVPDLEDVIHNVIESLAVVEREVRDRDGRWFSLRVRPYRTREGRIDGVVLILLDIDELKRTVKQVVSLAREPFLALTADLKVTRANDAFYRAFATTPEQAEGRSIYDVAGGAWNVPRLKQLLEEILPAQGEARDFRVEHEFPTIGKRTLLINARRFQEESRGVQLLLLAIQEAKA